MDPRGQWSGRGRKMEKACVARHTNAKADCRRLLWMPWILHLRRLQPHICLVSIEKRAPGGWDGTSSKEATSPKARWCHVSPNCTGHGRATPAGRAAWSGGETIAEALVEARLESFWFPLSTTWVNCRRTDPLGHSCTRHLAQNACRSDATPIGRCAKHGGSLTLHGFLLVLISIEGFDNNQQSIQVPFMH